MFLPSRHFGFAHRASDRNAAGPPRVTALALALLLFVGASADAQPPTAVSAPEAGPALLDPPVLESVSTPPAALTFGAGGEAGDLEGLAGSPSLVFQTEEGPIIVFEAEHFQRAGAVALRQGAGYLESRLDFAPGDARARARFTAPESTDYAIVAVHDGLGPLELAVQGRALRLPNLAAREDGAGEVTVLTTAFFAGTGNEIELRSSRGGGALRALFLSAPLARLRSLSLRHARLLASAHMLERCLEKYAAQARANGAGDDRYSAFLSGRKSIRQDVIAPLEGPWPTACLALWKRYDRIHRGPSVVEIGETLRALEGELRATEERLETLRKELAPDALTNPSDLRLPAGDAWRDAFAAYPWFALRAPFADAAEGAVGRLHALAIDALVLDPDAWPHPPQIDIMAREQAWCVLRNPEPLRRSAHTLSDGAPDIITENALRERIGAYAERPGAFGLVYWPEPSTPSASEPVSLPGVPARLEALRHSVAALRDHFRLLNRYVCEMAPGLARLGLFSAPSLRPWGFDAHSGVSGHSLLLDTGFPAVGIATGARPDRLGYVAGLARFDPAGRPWWDVAHPLLSSAEGDGATALERDLWRLLFWGVTCAEFDAGARGEDLYVSGAEAAGLLAPAWLRLAALKSDLMRVGKPLRNSRLLSGGAALLEPGLPMAEGWTRPATQWWTDWFVSRRLVPLWLPHEELAAPGEAGGLFDEFRLLVAPGPLVLSPERGQALMAWMERGGVLVTGNPLGYLTPEGRLAMAFRSAVGISMAEGEPGRWRLPADAEPGPGAEVLHRDASGRPQILIAPVGEGNLLVGLDGADACEIWLRLLDRTSSFLFSDPLVRCTAPPDTVEVLCREEPRGLLLCAVNLRTDRMAAADLEVAGEWATATDLTYEAALPLSPGVGRGSLRLTLEPGRGRCVLLEKAERSALPSETVTNP